MEGFCITRNYLFFDMFFHTRSFMEFASETEFLIVLRFLSLCVRKERVGIPISVEWYFGSFRVASFTPSDANRIRTPLIKFDRPTPFPQVAKICDSFYFESEDTRAITEAGATEQGDVRNKLELECVLSPTGKHERQYRWFGIHHQREAMEYPAFCKYCGREDEE